MSGESLDLHMPSGVPRRAGKRLAGIAGALVVMAGVLGLSALSPASAASAASAAGTLQGSHVLKPHGQQVVGAVRGKHKLPKPAIAGAANASFSSTNWDGYALTNTSNTNTTTFNSVSATWVQPAVKCNAGSSVGSSWVGLDGWLSSSVEQGGSDAECLNTMTPTYFLWWEMFPFNSVQDVVQINAGDTIHGSVTFDTTTNMFDIVITDETLHKGLSESIACQADMNGCPRSSAEVISEDTGGGSNVDGLFLLPKYSTETYTSASVTDVNGHVGTLSNSAWVANSVTEISSDDVTKQTVSALSPDGSSFSTAWREYSGDGVTVQVDYKALTVSPKTQELDIELEVVNTGDTPVDLSAVRPEYWFSEDSGSPLEFACDFATVGCSNVDGVFFSGIGTPANADTEVVLEFGSGAGTLAPGANSGEIEFRVFHSDFSTMTQTNDYSFNAADTTITPNPNIDSLIVGSGLNWGVPPLSSL